MQLMAIDTWSNYKTLINNKELEMQYNEFGDRYDIFASESPFLWVITLLKNTSDATDFENNYKSNCNKQVHQVIHISGFRRYDSGAENLYRYSVKDTATANDTKTIDKKFTEPVYLYGGIYEIVGNANDGDYLEIQVIDIDNVLGYGTNFVLATFVEKEYINIERKYNEITSEDGDLIPTGVYLRVKYTAAGSNTPEIIVRYKMRKQ